MKRKYHYESKTMDGPGTTEMTKCYTMEWKRRQRMEYGYMTGRGGWNKVT